jgi:hypothetical protein
MQLTKPKTLRRRPERIRKATARRAPEPRPRPVSPSVSQVRAHCGYAWTDEVTASPGCPHCGTPQAW